ncbi:hypothetical protein BO83DRAFT_90204 [Aspergillus eucalypticola CBS 122712]|uniref:Uncharacterized protein n=1 Tax=Aspergillus eucalypticola (strain CBS 122712 / IBT 29274) TaxID=1448314 RepID=A0A317V2G3_ASPEC|nr:uncharacterized protein BO83DRAFT_90204 [Aspergillus eucalypticola CBS 122712]PWY68285.1 hypothetical protein BO83DRAFT_90204 [Aspergillus eucalypticola CBS 122712]
MPLFSFQERKRGKILMGVVVREMVTTVMCHRYEGSGVVGISNNRQCMLRTILRRYSSPPPVSGSHPLTPESTGPKVRFDTWSLRLLHGKIESVSSFQMTNWPIQPHEAGHRRRGFRSLSTRLV